MNTAPASRRTYRSKGHDRGEGTEENGEESKYDVEQDIRKLGDYVKAVNKNTELFSSENADTILDTLVDYADKNGFSDYTVAKDKYKVKLPYISAKGEKAIIKVEISKVDSNTVCVDFTKGDGDSLVFYKGFNQIKEFFGPVFDIH